MRLDLKLFGGQVKSRCPVETIVIQQGHCRHLVFRTHGDQFFRRRSALKETERRPRMKLYVFHGHKGTETLRYRHNKTSKLLLRASVSRWQSVINPFDEPLLTRP